MKKKLNIICILIFIAIGAFLADSLQSVWSDMAWSFKKGWDDAGKSTEYDFTTDKVHLGLRPATIGYYSDSVYNVANEQWLPLQYREVFVQTEKEVYSGWLFTVNTLLAFTFIIASLVQLFTFVNLIRAINKSIIFAWSNVVKLRTIGVSMLIAFASNVLFSYFDEHAAMQSIDIPGYTLHTPNTWDPTWLIMGLSILLIAEIFAMGLRLQEDQDLTI